MSWLVLIGIAGTVFGYQLLVEWGTRKDEAEWKCEVSNRFPQATNRTSPINPHNRTKGDLPSNRSMVAGKDSERSNRSSTSMTDLAKDSFRWRGWREVIVDKVQDESPDCRSFFFRSKDGQPLAKFVGGQSILVSCIHPETHKRVSRCYSLSGGPAETNYRITVKRVPGGVLSNLLHDSIGEGDTLEIKAPSGKFHIDGAKTDQPLTLIAAGIGITPMLSMLLQSLEETPKRPIQIIYQLRNTNNAPFLKPLRRLTKSVAPFAAVNLKVWFSQPKAGTLLPNDQTGRVSATQIIQQLGHVKGEYLICGPNQFMSSIAEGLVNQGVKEQNVKYESFGGRSSGVGAIAVGPTQPTRHGPTVDQSNQQSFHVEFITSAKQTNWDSNGETLLDLAEQAEIEVDSSCRSGYCGACVHRLCQGKVQYLEEPECDVEDDEVALCIARPISDVQIEA